MKNKLKKAEKKSLEIQLIKKLMNWIQTKL